MAEYIKREDIKYESWAVGPLCAPIMVVRKKTIDSIPAADVAPVVHGFWKETDESVGWGDEPCAKCSVCDELWALSEWDFDSFKTFMHYCPNCGARMDGE